MEFSGASDGEIRDRAVESIKRKQAFRNQAFIFIALSAFFIVIWAVSGGNFFWPIFPIGAFVIALVAQGWSLYGPGSKPITEDQIARESERLRR